TCRSLSKGLVAGRLLVVNVAAPGENAHRTHAGVKILSENSTLTRYSPCHRLSLAARQVMLASLMAAGTGINLTSANHCFIADREFGPVVRFSRVCSLVKKKTNMIGVRKKCFLWCVSARVSEGLRRKSYCGGA
ncbi:unnamed protein product, partial [Scytosiphon promiscuus]